MWLIALVNDQLRNSIPIPERIRPDAFLHSNNLLAESGEHAGLNLFMIKNKRN
jgi:hypothetical protein